MSAKDNGGPAFPRAASRIQFSSGDVEYHEAAEGMSLRDWFAGQALIGLMHSDSARAEFDLKGGFIQEHAARLAYLCADALLSARARNEDEDS